MNTNRDQAVQNAIGTHLFGLIKDGIILFALFAVAYAMASIVLKLLGGPRAGSLLIVALAAPFFLAYLVSGANTGTVRGLSTHYVLIICGSGGHTAEMIQMVERSICPEKLSHRRWAVGKDDMKSYDKILAFERRLLDRFSRHYMDSGTFDIVQFGRARYVHQSWLTTPFTAILSLLDIHRILTTPAHQGPIPRPRYPGVIATNGPGTGFLFLLVARALKLLHVVPTSHMRAIYVESWARVKSLSLTGKLIQRLRLADLFIVQSRHLKGPGNILAENLLVMPQQPKVPFEN
ncbi:hypothetical protein O1611_g3002 [Lasiodiplodia mahajangana]|uniref:Uncharacterized protein n=1 Tax=Lasiodiplodia mahajangana TaxID=1108764 RepID=A0ACC2JTW6_9PEZI|nr:hypothetical protein O1611_g3002 [Lasiodiplodia mahajangana]